MDEHATFEPQAVLAPERKRRNAVALAVAGLVVAGTVGVGLLGTLTSAGPSPVAVAPTRLSPVADAAADARPSVPPATPVALPRYPGEVVGLPVWSAAYVAKNPRDALGPIAVSGWYAARPGTGCRTPRIAEDPALPQEFGVAADFDTFCSRAGEIFTAPMFAETATPIEVALTPGVPAPYELAEGGSVTAVVFVGRVVNPAPSCRAPRGCPSVLVVDRVAWADGTAQARTASVLPRLLDQWPPLSSPARDRLAERAGEDGQLLMETLVDPATLATIDPGAAREVEGAAPGAKRIWYRRTLGLDPARDAVRWVAIDDATGNVIASGDLAG